MSERFFRSNRTGYTPPVSLSWKVVMSEWRSEIAVSLNVGGGVRLTKPAKLYICTQKDYKYDEYGRTAPVGRGHGSVPLSLPGDVVTRIGLQQQKQTFPAWCPSAHPESEFENSFIHVSYELTKLTGFTGVASVCLCCLVTLKPIDRQKQSQNLDPSYKTDLDF